MYDSIGAMVFWLFTWPAFLYVGYLFAKSTAKKIDTIVENDNTTTDTEN